MVAPFSVSKLCKKCRDHHKGKYGEQYKSYKYKRKKAIIGICFRCKKEYKITDNRHPKYSYCNKCKIETKNIMDGIK